MKRPHPLARLATYPVSVSGHQAERYQPRCIVHPIRRDVLKCLGCQDSSRLSSSQIGNLLQDLVAGLDGLRIQFEATLSGNQIDQLFNRLNIGGFQRVLANDAQPLVPGTPSCAWPEASV